MNSLPVEELRILLAAVAKHGNHHLLEIEADIQQTAYLSNDAIDKLSKSFLRLNQKLKHQDAWSELQRNEVADDIACIVMGLQFQDMTNQLLHGIIKRVTGLKELLQELASHEFEMDASNEHKEILGFLSKANKSLDHRSQGLAGNFRQSVGQKNLNAGDVDLF